MEHRHPSGTSPMGSPSSRWRRTVELTVVGETPAHGEQQGWNAEPVGRVESEIRRSADFSRASGAALNSFAHRQRPAPRAGGPQRAS
ncbi:unnamed protein product [Gadus morhua 'NCC']